MFAHSHMYNNCRDIHEHEREMREYGIVLWSFDGEGFSELKPRSLCCPNHRAWARLHHEPTALTW